MILSKYHYLSLLSNPSEELKFSILRWICLLITARGTMPLLVEPSWRLGFVEQAGWSGLALTLKWLQTSSTDPRSLKVCIHSNFGPWFHSYVDQRKDVRPQPFEIRSLPSAFEQQVGKHSNCESKNNKKSFENRKENIDKAFYRFYSTSCFVSCLDFMFQCKLLDLKSNTILNGLLKNPLEVGHLRSYLLDLASKNFMQQHATEVAGTALSQLGSWHIWAWLYWYLISYIAPFGVPNA